MGTLADANPTRLSKRSQAVPLHIVVVMFEARNSILDYCVGSVPKFCLPGIALTPCFKVVLIVALSGYVIRLFSQ